MRYPFESVRQMIRELPKPDTGSRETWDEWYSHAWRHVTDAGIVNVDSPIDDTRSRLHVFVLCWLAHDFCAVCFGEDSGPELYWSEWIECLKLNPLWAWVIGSERKPAGDAFSEAMAFEKCEMSVDDDEAEFDRTDCEQDLEQRVCAVAARRLRPQVVKALITGFGDESLLFASLFAACGDLDRLVGLRRSAMEDEVDDINDELEQEVDPESLRELQERLVELATELQPEKLADKVRQSMLDDAVGDTVYFGDEDSESRLRGHEWCRQHCRVVLRGNPGV